MTSFFYTCLSTIYDKLRQVRGCAEKGGFEPPIPF